MTTYNVQFHCVQTGENLTFPSVTEEQVKGLELVYYSENLIEEGWAFKKEVAKDVEVSSS